MTEGAERQISRLAARQKTIVSGAQLRALGLGRRAIKYRVETGRLHVVFRDIYSVGCGELPPLAREQAALLACGRAAFISHRSAALIWGLDNGERPEVEVSVVGRYCASREGIRVHRIRAIDRRELRQHEGLWVSSPARTVLEIAALASINEVEWTIERGLVQRVLEPREVDAVLARNERCRGAARVAAVIGDDTATEMIRSRTEKHFLRLMRDAGLPRPDVNVGRGRSELDFVWRDQRLVVEIDGYTFHRGPAAFRRDHEKNLVLQDDRFEIMRFTHDHVEQRPILVVARVAAALARRTPPD
jgi:very-short-patch-repair endonuclease